MRRLDAFNYEARDAAETGVIERGPHRIRWSVSGNPRRMPIVVSHGGPGDQNKAFYRTLFDLDKWRMVQIDQPGNGVSEPAGEIAENTTQLSIRDMENLREQLGMEQWVVAGGSWGSTLSIAYAETLPERTRALFLFCMWLGESESLNFWFDAGQHIFPECYAEVVGGGPFLVGVLSDCFAPTHGPAIGLQYALAIAVAVTLWGLFHYFFLIKSYPQDRLVPENLQEEDSQ